MANSPLNALRHEVLHVMMVQIPGTEWLERPGSIPGSWRRLERAFAELHPNVRLRLSMVPEDALAQELRLRQLRGLGPDLLVMRTPVAISLVNHAMIDPVPATAAMQQAISTLDPASLARVRSAGRLAGLPIYHEVTLACFDRRQVRQSPRDLEDLLALAAAGTPIGLAVDPPGIWWTAGGLGADRAVVPILIGKPLAAGARGVEERRRDREAIVVWMQWLRHAALQTRVDVASGQQELVQGLESGRLAWIPCLSPVLPRLEKTLGPNLGVAPLPDGPAGQASPFSSLRVWGFGRDSSPRQRQLAEELAILSLNPVLQRALTLNSRSLLPVNRYVPLPVASSGQLAALAEAEQQFRSGSPLLASPFSADRVRKVLPPVLDTLSQVMVGAVTPASGAAQLMRLQEVR